MHFLGDHAFGFAAGTSPPNMSFIILSAITPFASAANIVNGANRRHLITRANFHKKLKHCE
jgi:hypothetical protein